MYRYKTQTGPYSDAAITQQGGENVDASTARQTLLAKQLNAIQQDVAKSRAQVSIAKIGKKKPAGQKKKAEEKKMALMLGDFMGDEKRLVGVKGTENADEVRDGVHTRTCRATRRLALLSLSRLPA